MDRFNALGRGLQVMLVGGVLLFIDTFLHWQSVDTPIGSFGRNAWHGFWGIILGLLVIALLAWIGLRLAAVDVNLRASTTLIAAGLALLILLFAIIKTLTDDFSAWPSYVGIILAAVIAVGAWLQVQETGGVEALRTEASTMRPARQSAQAPPTTSAPPPSHEPAAAPPPPPVEPPAAPSEPSGAPPASGESSSEPA